VARRQSYKALPPAAASHSHTRSLLPFQRSCSERLPGGGLAVELPRCGLHPLAVVAPARRCWIGNAAPSPSAPGRLFPVSAGMDAAWNPLRLRSGLSAKVAGNVWAPSEAFEGQDRCSFLKPSMACQRLGLERRCPLVSPVQAVVQFKKQRQAAQPWPSSGRLAHSPLVVVAEWALLSGSLSGNGGPRA
jgi:hypothetical protein